MNGIPEGGVAWLLRSRRASDLLNWPLSSWLQFLIAAICLVAVVIAVIQLIARANKETDPAEAEREMLLALSELYRQGDLTNEEFRSIKGQILQRLKSVSPAFSAVRKSAESAAKRRSADCGEESSSNETDRQESGTRDNLAEPGPDGSR